jgi:hypothetical protein
MWSSPPVNNLEELALKARDVTVFWWFDMARRHRPPATMSHTRRIDPAADKATVPDGYMSTCSTGTEPVVDLPDVVPISSSHSPVRVSKMRTVPSYEPVRIRWGSVVETWPERT